VFSIPRFVLWIDVEVNKLSLILRIIQDSSVSNTSHHPQSGEEGKLQPSWLQLYLYVLRRLTMQELLEKLGSVANVWRLGVPGECRQHPEAGSKAEIYTKRSFTQAARSYVTKELWAVSYINPLRINTVVTALTM
jgi:hypothetical protein